MAIKRIILAAVLLAAALSGLQAQTLEVRKVPSDSLVRFIRQNCGTRIYIRKDAEDVADFSVSAPKEEFLGKALDLLKEKGYYVSTYDGAWFISSGSSLATRKLPENWFSLNTGKEADDISDEDIAGVTATFRNKIYEIGEQGKSRGSKAFVSGYVKDENSGEPLPGVSVYDKETGNYTTSDAHGFYRIEMPVGDRRLGFSAATMEDLDLSLKVWSNGGLDVTMKEKVISLKGAVVSAQARRVHRDARLGLERVNINTIKNIPTAFGQPDVLKVILTLPGVKSNGEAVTGFNVRGGSAEQNLILFNDGTIFNPSHMFGVLSAFNPDVINDVELYKSSIPAEFGGRISSVLDIRGKEGSNKKFSGSVGLGLLTSSVLLEGPISKGKTSFVLGGRTSYSNWMLKVLPANSAYHGGAADFSDVNIGITHKANDKNSFHAYGYWSRDSFGFSGDTTFRYSNLNAALKWRHQINEGNDFTLTGGYDSFQNALQDDGFRQSVYSSNVNQAFAKMAFRSSLGVHKLSYGISGIYYMLNPGTVKALSASSPVKDAALDRQNAADIAAYFSDAITFNDKFSIEAGVRLSNYLALNPNKYYFYPEVRVSGKYSIKSNLSVKAGFNSMSQNIHMISNSTSISPMDSWRLSSAALRPQTGWQAAAGLYWTVADGTVDISAEGYYKHLSHYPDYKSGAVLTMNPDLEEDLVETEGKAYGAELMVRKSAGKLNGWISYSYSRSLLRETGDRGIATINGGAWYNAPHDKPHDVKMVLNYKMTHRFSASVNLDYSTGRPVTIPIGKYQYLGRYVLAYSQRNEYRIPDYFRMDVALNIEPSHYLKQLTHLSVTVGCYNVTARKNAYSVYYTADQDKVTGHMLSVFAMPIPYINLNLKF